MIYYLDDRRVSAYRQGKDWLLVQRKGHVRDHDNRGFNLSTDAFISNLNGSGMIAEIALEECCYCVQTTE
jgi:hypothetical protein